MLHSLVNVVASIFLATFSLNSASANEANPDTKTNTTIQTSLSDCQQLYLDMHLENIINYTVFEKAMAGYNNINTQKNEIFSLVDFSKPSTEKRFYVLDLRHKKLLYLSHVAHGKNSGENYATSFSNKKGSHKSSLGFYRTGGTYDGRNGYSLLLDGLEPGFNDLARERAIVIHGASYCDPNLIPSDGRLGRSFGCPALPEPICEEIINTIKDGTLLFIYANDQNYLSHSKLLKNELTKKSFR